jgi:sigma-B regulation protein RsbU (phosphoserine phosphatase)
VLLSSKQAPRWAVEHLGTALGLEPGLAFESNHMVLKDGDTVVFYTDGVSEAFNTREECYGSPRLLADAGSLSGRSAPAITAGLLERVRAFADGAPQSDDIAILAVKFRGEPAHGADKECLQ